MALLLCATLLAGAAQADEPRTWTDVDGRTIEAQMLGVGDGKVRVMLRGRETEIPLERLSADDVRFVEEWEQEWALLEEQRAAQATMFAGRQLEMGGKSNQFQFDYDPDVRERLVREFQAEDTGYRIAIAVPEGFDSREHQKVFILANAQNSQQQSRMGNVAAIGNFAATAVAEGWVCLAYDSNLGNDVRHIAAWNQAMRKLSEEWPEFNNWTFACGGNSGGAKGAMLHATYHIKQGRQVRGLFLTGCNGAENLVASRAHHGLSRNDLRDTWCFISNRSNDSKVSPQHFAAVVSTLRAEGIRTIRDEWQEVDGGIHQPHLAAALRWFAENEPDQRGGPLGGPR